jgi:hypothetical protein
VRTYVENLARQMLYHLSQVLAEFKPQYCQKTATELKNSQPKGHPCHPMSLTHLFIAVVMLV